MTATEKLNVQNRKQWREWLKQNYTSSKRIWLVISKKSRGTMGISLEDAVEEAVAFGWIDSKLHVADEETVTLLFTPRKPGSIWSESNKRRVEKLIQHGLMMPAGMERVETAKRDRSWNKLDAINELRLPPNLEEAFAADLVARKNFDAFTDSAKKQILWWIESAKKPETRQKRIQKATALAHQNKNPLVS